MVDFAFSDSQAWKRALQGLSGGLMSRGQGGTFSQGLLGGFQNFDQGQQADLQRRMEEERLRLLQEEADARRTESQKKAQFAGKIQGLLNPGLAGPNNGRPGGMAPQQPSPLAGLNLSPAALSILKETAQFDPEGAYSTLLKFATDKPDAAGPPEVKDFYEGGRVVQKQWNPQSGTWEQVGEGPRWQPQSAGESWEPYVDQKTGKTGQKNVRTGRVDWDPGQSSSVMAQVGTDANGNPIYDFVQSGGKPLSDAASQMTLRSTMIGQALEDIKGINFENVGSAKTATGQWLSQTNPIGEVAGQMILNDDEKKLIGAQGKIQEAVISAITGSAYNEEQKRNMRAAMVPLATDSATRRVEKLKAAAQFMMQLDKNSAYNRIQGDDDMSGWEDYGDGVLIREKP